MTVISSTLARRGFELASLPDFRGSVSGVFADPYDPIRNPNGFVNMGTAENYAMLPEVTAFVNKNLTLDKTDFSYGDGPWGSPRLAKAFAKHMERHFGSIHPIDPQQLVLTNGVTALCEMLGFALCNPGDGVVFPRPIYQAFLPDFDTKAKVKSVFVNFGDLDQFSLEAISKYEEAIEQAEKEGVRVRALMLCNPHNPLGQCYPKETIIGLMQLCNRRKVHLLCDEIYATSVYDVPDKHALPFTSALSIDYEQYISPNYLHVIYGMSKDFAGGGLRIGCLYVKNKELMRALSAINQFHWTGGPSQRIGSIILEDHKWIDDFILLGRERLSSRNKLTRRLLDDAEVKYHPGSNAGFFIWADLRQYLPDGDYKDDWDRENALMKRFMEHKVFVTNGQALSAEEPGWFRLIFSQDEQVIHEGIQRFTNVIKGHK